jgi:L-alanine-DL-glutamate epimerase-like enolase superfamily enzyme
MGIARLEAIPYALRLKRPYATASGTLERRELVLVRLHTDGGPIGLGEAVPLSLRGGLSLARVLAELRGLADRINEGSELDERRLRGMARAMLSSPARAAIEIALDDIAGRVGAHPANSGPVTCNATLVMDKPARVAEDALAWAAAGFATFKLKLGDGDDIGQVRAVREALGPEARIRIDANGAWDIGTAMQRLGELEELDIELMEEPVATLEEMAAVRRATSIPVAADESVSSREEAERAARLGACDLTGVKLSKVGGPQEALNVSRALPTYVSSALDGPVGIAAGARVAGAMLALPGSVPGDAGVAHGLATQRLFADTIASVECELRGDRLHLPPGPGLGVEIDESALERHRL